MGLGGQGRGADPIDGVAFLEIFQLGYHPDGGNLNVRRLELGEPLPEDEPG